MARDLLELPGELLAAILDKLSREDLFQVNLTSQECRKLAAPLIWKHVDLIDCRAHTSSTGIRTVTYGPGSASYSGRGIPAGANVGGSDEHDDTPLIKKLWVLATQPWLAASVETVTHRCHLTPPNMFTELPKTPFSSQTLSIDPRTICLVRLAVRNMTRVNTLRVVFGHPKLTEALLRCFFDEKRQREKPVRRVWLENVRVIEGIEMTLETHKYGLPLKLDFDGVETIRLRRLPLGAVEMPQKQRNKDRSTFVYSRGGTSRELQNGLGGNYLTSANMLGTEVVRGHEQFEQALDNDNDENYSENFAQEWPLMELMQEANRFDDAIYTALSKDVELPKDVKAAYCPSHHWRSVLAYRKRWAGPACELSPTGQGPWMFKRMFRTDPPTAAECTTPMFESMSATLTSLTIDWAITAPSPEDLKWTEYERWIKWYIELFSLRLPHLRAFQYRNAVAVHTLLPPGLFLLDNSTVFTGTTFEQRYLPGHHIPTFELGLKPLEFLEAHPNLQCLAWPTDRFFSPDPNREIAPRVREIISKLGRTLVDLRVDAFYTGTPEPHSDDSFPLFGDLRQLTRSRRRFISEFAAEMRVVKSVKVEGGMPLDERREIASSLHRCPLEKLVFIGVASVIGNTWGAGASNFTEILPFEDVEGLESEDENAIYNLGSRPPAPLNKTFEASYGWTGRPPMLHTIVSHHGNTLRELKFCGYKGAINLYNPTAIARPMLAALKYCHALETLVMSFWLSTIFEDALRDDEVISYWLNRRDSSTTSLVSLSDEPELGSWAHELKTKFAPKALAWSISRFLGPFLSETAKRRKGGVRVRASFCVGDSGGIFDIDVKVGKGSLESDVCLGFEGPREEMEENRRREKLESRRWF